MSTPEATAARTPILRHLDRLVDSARHLSDGEPREVGVGDPNGCGAAICTVDGHVYGAGDVDVEFAIQSISKSFTYALALCDRGTDYVDQKINVEPSGEAFNEISLDGEPGRPANPLVNIGAIAADWCVTGDRFPRILEFYERLAGRSLAMSEEVYQAEGEGAARNRALAWLLTSAGVIEGDPGEALDAYLRQCSVLVTATDLAIMGATLANRGVQPVTGDRVMSEAVAERVLSVMATCGMYDDAGAWMIRVGLPAKSGVGGGIVAAASGQLGIGTFGPPLDGHGNSVRGTEMCAQLSHDFDLHFARVPRPHHSTVRRVVELSPEARLVELQGGLAFLGIEAALQAVLTAAEDRPAVVVDMTRVTHLVAHARDLLPQLTERLRETGHRLIVVGGESLLGDATVCRDVDEALAVLAD
ncbi:glutaminase A [Granulicoccus sp. GXG6511]|uniref:glutaminase A n=1 Tax=Granulicoccus sp. GXG6511 TaxID=3381351 RepID=UPI003D7C6A98